jgi:hypothetical protein
MENIIRGHLILISIVLIAFLAISGRKVDVCIRTPQYFDIHYDELLTDACKANITQFIESLNKHIALHPEILAAVIQEQFPFIRSVQSRLVPPGTMKLQCMTFAPLCILNQTLLLVPPQNICSNSYYCTNVWENLPHLMIDEAVLKTYDPRILIKLVNSLNKDIFNQFNVVVATDRTLIFEDKAQPKFSLVCRIDNVPSATLCMHAQHMKELLESRKAFSEKSSIAYVADLRFEKQIILSKK